MQHQLSPQLQGPQGWAYLLWWHPQCCPDQWASLHWVPGNQDVIGIDGSLVCTVSFYPLSFTNSTCQRTSAIACANFYNTSMAKSNEPLPGWSFGFLLSTEHLWSAFLLYCLFEDATKQQEYLILIHTGDQKDHFNEPVQVQNQHMCIEGQPELTHFCDKCTCWFYGPDGSGEYILLLNHSCLLIDICSQAQMFSCCHRWCLCWPPCCGSQNCQVPLSNNQDHFCVVHADLKAICAIVSCSQPVVSSHLICTNLIHQCVESHHQDRG